MATLTECKRGSSAVNLINLSFFLFLWLTHPLSLPSYRRLVFGTGARGITNPELFPVAVPVFLLCCLDRYPPSHKSNGILLALLHLCPCQRFVSRIARCCTSLWEYFLKGECRQNECWVTMKWMILQFMKVHVKSINVCEWFSWSGLSFTTLFSKYSFSSLTDWLIDPVTAVPTTKKQLRSNN